VKHLPTFISIVVLAWAVAAAIRVPGKELSMSVPAYLIAQCFFALIAWWGLQRAHVSSRSYVIFFALGFLIVLLMAVLCTSRFLSALPRTLAAVAAIAGMASASATAMMAYWKLLNLYPHGVPATLISTIFQGSILSACGSATLLTLFADLPRPTQVAAMSLGLFWLLLGSFFFAYSAGILRMHTTWSRLNHYIPMMLAIIAFGWLALNLSGLQREMARETVSVNQAAEVSQ